RDIHVHDQRAGLRVEAATLGHRLRELWWLRQRRRLEAEYLLRDLDRERNRLIDPANGQQGDRRRQEPVGYPMVLFGDQANVLSIGVQRHTQCDWELGDGSVMDRGTPGPRPVKLPA